MLLKDKDGIRCDLCGMSHREKFTYYSIQLFEVTVDASRLATSEAKEAFDFDADVGCFDQITNKIKAVEATDTSLTITCRNCGKVMKNQFKYFLFRPTKVVVDKDVTDQGPASVEKDIYEVPMCETCGAHFKEKAAETKAKHKKGEEWS